MTLIDPKVLFFLPAFRTLTRVFCSLIFLSLTMPVRLKYVSYLIPFLHWWPEFFTATAKLTHLRSWPFYVLEKVRFLNDRNKQSGWLIFWLVNRLKQTIHLKKYSHLNGLVQFVLLKGNNTQASRSEALRRHPFINRYFAHLFEVVKFVEPFVLEPAFFLTGFCCCCPLFCLFVCLFVSEEGANRGKAWS